MPPGTVAAEHHQASDKAPKKLKRTDGGEKRKAEGLNVGARSIVEAQANKVRNKEQEAKQLAKEGEERRAESGGCTKIEGTQGIAGEEMDRRGGRRTS
jgi:hypothetical protein